MGVQQSACQCGGGEEGPRPALKRPPEWAPEWRALPRARPPPRARQSCCSPAPAPGGDAAMSPRHDSPFDWMPTSPDQLAETEAEVLRCVAAPARVEWCAVPAAGGALHTLRVTRDAGGGAAAPPLVLLHGLLAAAAYWALNLRALSAHATVYVVDWVGFGRSSRVPFRGSGPAAAERYFLDALDEWLARLQLQRPVLLGHSLGAYLAAAYALQHPARVRALILEDPWGLPPRPPGADECPLLSNEPPHIRAAGALLMHFTPLMSVRVAGPLGPDIVQALREKMVSNFEGHLSDPAAISRYVWHCNAQEPTGEEAFMEMQEIVMWARRPLAGRLRKLAAGVGLHWVFGGGSWAVGAKEQGLLLHQERGGESSYLAIAGAGHNPHFEAPAEFDAHITALLCSIAAAGGWA